MRDETTHARSHFNGGLTTESRTRVNNYIPLVYVDVIIRPCPDSNAGLGFNVLIILIDMMHLWIRNWITICLANTGYWSYKRLFNDHQWNHTEQYSFKNEMVHSRWSICSHPLPDCRHHDPGRSEFITLQWRHNKRDGVSNHQPHDCLLNRLFRRKSKKTSKIRVIGLCVGNSPVNSPHKGQVMRKTFPFDDVIMFHRILQDYFTGTGTMQWLPLC